MIAPRKYLRESGSNVVVMTYTLGEALKCWRVHRSIALKCFEPYRLDVDESGRTVERSHLTAPRAIWRVDEA
jgi:hypothetical protein